LFDQMKICYGWERVNNFVEIIIYWLQALYMFLGTTSGLTEGYHSGSPFWIREMRNCCKILVGKLRRRWEESIRVGVKGMWWESEYMLESCVNWADYWGRCRYGVRKLVTAVNVTSVN
jgi:hypothetical protein